MGDNIPVTYFYCSLFSHRLGKGMFWNFDAYKAAGLSAAFLLQRNSTKGHRPRKVRQI